MFAILLPLFFLFIMGLAVGSFLNVVIYRSVHNDSPFRGRSYCDNCKNPIAWYDNVPLISFLLLHRRCRHCHMEIPWEYPTVEFLTGSLFVWWYMVGSTFFQLTIRPFVFLQPLFWLMVGIILLVIFFADLSYYLIPDSAVLILSFLSIAYRVILTFQGVMQGRDLIVSLVAAIAASGFFLLLLLITRGKGMGMGDVKLAFPLALIVGYPGVVVATLLSFIIGAVVGVILILIGKRSMKGMIPFGPFMIAGSLIALLWGDQLLTWYLHLL